MSLSPIAFISPNFRDFKNYWLKAYEPGTTTPKSMALDAAGVTTVAKLELNKDGFLESAGGALVIPYVDGFYDAYLFPTEAEADANNTSNAERVADNILGVNGAGIANSTVLKYDTLADAVAETNTAIMFDGAALNIKERTTGNGGGAMWDVVLSSTVTENTYNIVQCTGVATLSLVARIGLTVNPSVFGVVYDAKFRNATDGKYYTDAGFTTASTNNQLAMQASWDYAYFNNGNIRDGFGPAKVETIVTPPASVTEPRGDAFTASGAGGGNVFVQTYPLPLCTKYVNERGINAPVIDVVDRKGFVNTGGQITIKNYRLESDSQPSEVMHWDQLGEYSKLEAVEMLQFGEGDGLVLDYFMKGNIERCNILNKDAFTTADGVATRFGAAVRIKAGDGGGIPTIKKVTGRGFDTAFVLGENATSSDNMSGLKLEQCESSVVRVGIEIKPNTLKPTLDTCYFEGIEEVHIIDNGTSSDIHSGIHFVNAQSLGGVTYYKCVTATKGNNFHHNYIETNTQGDTLIDMAFDEHKSAKHNTIIYAGTTKTGVSGIIVRGIFPKIDLSSNNFTPRGAWLGGNTVGAHTGANNASVLTNSAAVFNPDGLINLTITNTTDGSTGTITANTKTTITATLSGGTDDDWDAGDSYSIDNSTAKIRYLDTGNALTGLTQAQNGDNFSCPMIHGAISYVKGQSTLTEADVSGNTLTLPDDVNVFDFAPTIPVSINNIVGTGFNNQPIRFNCTNADVTFTDSAFIQTAGGVSYTGKGAIEFLLRRSGASSYFADENYRVAYL